MSQRETYLSAHEGAVEQLQLLLRARDLWHEKGCPLHRSAHASFLLSSENIQRIN